MALLFPLLMLLRITFYHATGSPMANGQMPYAGAAACSKHYALGTVIGLAGPDGWLELVCADRGHINREPWVDVFCPDAACGRRIARDFSPYSYGVVIAPK